MLFFILLNLFAVYSQIQQIPILIETSFPRLISTSAEKSEWMTEKQVTKLYQKKIKFIDETDGYLKQVYSNDIKTFKIPNTPVCKKIIKPMLKFISKDFMTDFLTRLTGFHTRYYKSPAGKLAADWILNEAQNIASLNTNTNLITVVPFLHSWKQQSVIVRIEPKGYPKNEKFILISAHLDSINQWNPYFGTSPGADDNGSGSTTIMETFRVFVETGYIPEIAIEFHWYSAEEAGLLGSQEIASTYRKQNASLVAQFHVDMVGYTPKNKKEIIGIATDYVDTELMNLMKLLVKEYLNISWKNTKCGYGCSDHATWNKLGYRTAFVFESEFDDHSPYIHSVDDTVSNIDFSHMKHFVKLVIAWGVEMSAKYNSTSF